MEEFFHMIVAVLLFLSAVAFGVTGVRRVTEAVATPAFAIRDAVVFEKSHPAEEDSVKTVQLAARLLRGSEFEIRVVFGDETSILIPAMCIDTNAIQRICLADADGYDETYDYDEQGEIQGLIFTQIKKE